MARPRASKTAVTKLLDRADFPIYALDDERIVVYCNDAFARWTDERVDDVLGTRCDYHWIPEVAENGFNASGLCPPIEAFSGHRLQTTVAVQSDNGQLRRRNADVIPMGPHAQCAGVLVFVSGDELADAADSASFPTPDILHDRLRSSRHEYWRRFAPDRFLGGSSQIRRARRQILLASSGCYPRVLIVGPVGSGREHTARTIHTANDPGQTRMLVPLSCALMDADLMQATIGAFVQHNADMNTECPGTILLLEIDQLQLDGQVTLVEFLKKPEFKLQVLATSRQPLTQLCEESNFNEELAFALSTLVIEIPPLSERISDVPLLAQAALERANALGKRQLSGFTDEALTQLLDYTWPGNVDELFEIITSAHSIAGGPLVTDGDLPERLKLASDAERFHRPTTESVQLDDYLANIEKELITRALRVAKANKAQAAKLLGISRARLLRRIESLEVNT